MNEKDCRVLFCLFETDFTLSLANSRNPSDDFPVGFRREKDNYDGCT